MCRHENEKRSTKKRKNEIRRKIDDDAILYSFQNFFIKKIFYLILKKLDDHLKKQKNKKENDILKIIQKTRKSKRKKNQKITKTRKEKFVKKSNHNQSLFIFENESRFHFFRQTKKNRWASSFNKSVTYETWQFRENISKCEKDFLFFFCW